MNTNLNPRLWNYPVKSKTEENYKKQVDALFTYSYELESLPWIEKEYPSYCDMAYDLIRRSDLKNSTKRTYRSAFLWYLHGIPVAFADQQEAIGMLKGMKFESAKNGRTLKGGTRQRNTISESDLRLLLEMLKDKASTSVWARRLLLWIPAGLACGARPSEWPLVDWENSKKTHVRIVNSKVHLSEPAFMRDPLAKAQAQADAEQHLERTSYYFDPEDRVWPAEETSEDFRLVQLIDGESESVQAHLDSINLYLKQALGHVAQRQFDFEHYHEQCGCVLRRACLKIWNGRKKFHLYTFRGQFSANRRAGFMGNR